MDELKNERKSRRAGGRAARHAERAAPLAEDLRPVRPGMTGGNYKPLTGGGHSSNTRRCSGRP